MEILWKKFSAPGSNWIKWFGMHPPCQAPVYPSPSPSWGGPTETEDGIEPGHGRFIVEVVLGTSAGSHVGPILGPCCLQYRRRTLSNPLENVTCMPHYFHRFWRVLLILFITVSNLYTPPQETPPLFLLGGVSNGVVEDSGNDSGGGRSKKSNCLRASSKLSQRSGFFSFSGVGAEPCSQHLVHLDEYSCSGAAEDLLWPWVVMFAFSTSSQTTLVSQNIISTD